MSLWRTKMGTIIGAILIIIVVIMFLKNPKKFLDKMSDWINKHK